MEKLGKPISPDQVGLVQEMEIPPKVFDAFNAAIAKHWNGRSARFIQEDVIDTILGNMNEGLDDEDDARVKRADVFKYHWLDVEAAYRDKGWSVEYDKPAYNESYSANFTFTRKR